MRKTASALQTRLFSGPGRMMITTRKGEVGIVAQDVGSHEQTGETLALLKILTLGNCQVEQGKVTPARLALKTVRERRKRRP